MATEIGTHPDITVNLQAIGRERAPLLIIDNFVSQPDWLISQAMKSQFTRNSPFYPGVRAVAPVSYQRLLLSSLRTTLVNAFTLPGSSLGLSVCHYSIVTTPPQQLHLLQRIPHFDTPDTHALAAVHYLFAGDQGGTAFYRHRNTGFEYIDEKRAPTYFQSLENENDGPDMPKPSDGYINGDSALFEQISHQPGVFNRLIVYRRNSLHSGAIPSHAQLSADPQKGRLTISSFIDCHMAPGAEKNRNI